MTAIEEHLVNRRWRTSVSATRTLPGADCGSDHEMLMCEFKFHLKCFKKSPKPIRYNLQEIPLNIEIKNRFRALLDTAEEMEPNEMAEEITQVYKEAAANLSSWFFAAAMANLRPQNLPLSAIYCKFHYFS